MSDLHLSHHRGAGLWPFALGALVCCLLRPLSAAAATATPPVLDVRAQYTKYEHRIPMRDGVHLFTAVYVPKDADRTYPLLMLRTPYGVGPYGPDQYPRSLGPSEEFQKDGFIFVYQDVRGRMRSEGQYVHMRPMLSPRPAAGGPAARGSIGSAPRSAAPLIDESTDTYDTIEWLLQHVPNHNGRVGLYGISYPGFYAAAGGVDAHPALKAISPQAPIADWFVGDDFHHHGAFYLLDAFSFFTFFGRMRPAPPGALPLTQQLDFGSGDAYRMLLRLGGLPEIADKHPIGDSFFREALQHEAYDAFWQRRDLSRHLAELRPAVLTVGGWFDAEDLFGPLQIHRRIEAGRPRGQNLLVMGPWIHGGWARTDGSALGDVSFAAPTSQLYREKIELPFFRQHLKGDKDPRLPKAYMFETGTNVWRKLPAWPPLAARPRRLYLRGGEGLSFDAPAEAEAYDEYISDPRRPVPYLGSVGARVQREYMTADQRFASTRPDVLVYETAPLATDLTVAGPIAVDLRVSTSGTDADWIVKLIDVYPETYPDPAQRSAAPCIEAVVPYSTMGGYQQLVRGEPMRGKFRDSYEKPAPFVPGQPTAVRFTMPDAFHTFRAGHRVMIQVQSTWFPLVNLNPQRFMNIGEARAADFQRATQRVYRSRALPSSIELLVYPEKN